MVDHVKNQKRKWFKSRNFIWGWYPSSWQGWVVLSFCIVVLLYGSWVLLPFGSLGEFNSDSIMVWLLFVVMVIGSLVAVVWETGGRPRRDKQSKNIK